MTEQAITITHRDVDWHEAFLLFVPKVFERLSFRQWHEHGGWDERYTVFAIVEDGRIIASASLTRMEVILSGERVQGWQLGAVGTIPEYRGRGLQNQILPRLLAHAGSNDLVFLFGNHHVVDFYPKFGFVREREWMFQADHSVAPAGEPLRTLALANAEDRKLLQRIAARAEPVTSRFGAQNYGQLVLWYWCNFYREGLRYAPDHDAIFVVEQAEGVLRIYDVLSATPLDLRGYLPRLTAAPVQRLEFGFTPTRFWADPTIVLDYSNSPLFVRGPHRMPLEEFKFPMLAQT